MQSHGSPPVLGATLAGLLGFETPPRVSRVGLAGRGGQGIRSLFCGVVQVSFGARRGGRREGLLRRVTLLPRSVSGGGWPVVLLWIL